MPMRLENFQKTFDSNKLLRLLGAKENTRITLKSKQRIDLLAEEIEGMLKPQLSYRMLDVLEIKHDEICLINDTRFKSSKLACALADTESVCCFLATIGPAVEMEVRHLMRQRHHSEAYILDAMGSLSVENIVEQFYQRMAKRQHKINGAVTLRFSPGYCDWPIQQQQELFDLFTDTDTPQIVLNESFLMLPQKSISGLFGLLPPGGKGVDPAYNPCRICTQRDCIARRSN